MNVNRAGYFRELATNFANKRNTFHYFAGNPPLPKRYGGQGLPLPCSVFEYKEMGWGLPKPSTQEFDYRRLLR